ncbi:MAG: hypothetical protein HOP14_05680, partial [Acidobacteria bacterium]|nr:hypothetical protein [Acidobacteriota bacterium]
MLRIPRLAVGLSLSALLLVFLYSGSPLQSQAGLAIDGYVLVSEVRVSRTVSQYTYRAQLTNAGGAIAGAVATATSTAAATTLVDSQLTFGPVGAGQSAPSTDTFSFRHDRTKPFNWAAIQWTAQAQAINAPPEVDAGPDQAIQFGEEGLLAGTVSDDGLPAPPMLAVEWAQQAGPGVATFGDPASASTTATFSAPGVYTLRLTASDGDVTAFDEVLVEVDEPNAPPVADAGVGQRVSPGDVVQLDGSGSSDADGDPLTFAWRLVSAPNGSAAVLGNATTVAPTLTTDLPGDYVVELVVNDGMADSAPDQVIVSTVNTAPVADAGADATALVGSLVALSGAGSSDPDGNAIDYSWQFVSRPAGSGAALAGSSSVTPSFTPDVAGDYIIRLTVTDGFLADDDEVTVSTRNTAPVADAGADDTVLVGDVVILNGSASSDVDGDPLTFSWSLTVPPGSTAALDDPALVSPRFTVDVPGAYVAQLIVNDGALDSAPDTVMLTTDNTPPVARAGADQAVNAGDLVLLDGSASSDADGDALTFAWSFTSVPDGSVAVLAGAQTSGPSFTADLPGLYVAQLIVNDGTANSLADTVEITSGNVAPVADAGDDQSGVPTGTPVVLNGLDSADADGHGLTYRWSFVTRPPGSGASLVDPSAAVSGFTPDLPGDYVVQLIVNDGFVDSPPDTVLVQAVAVPVADAGPDQTVPLGSDVTLDGSGSSTSTGALTYAWSFASVPDGSTAVLQGVDTITPSFTADVAGVFIVELTVSNGSATDIDSVAITVAGATPVVNVTATDGSATEGGTDPGAFTISRTGAITAPLTVAYVLGGTTSPADFTIASADTVTIPAGQVSATILIEPIDDDEIEGAETVTLTVVDGAAYDVGAFDSAAVTISDNDRPVVTIVATDGTASEAGGDTGTFTVSRTGPTASPLLVTVTVAGTASAGTDYQALGGSITIAVGEASATLTVEPVLDTVPDDGETVVVSIQPSGAYTVGAAGEATVTIADAEPAGDALINGFNHTGEIAVSGELDFWTFTATAGDAISLSAGEIAGTAVFSPWLRLRAPDGTQLASDIGTVAQVNVLAAPATGVYTVVMGSNTGGGNTTGTGTYRLTLAQTPGAFVVPAGDEGGALTNGQNHSGAIHLGDLDQWTFTANAGDAIALSIGEVSGDAVFSPWLRLRAPNGSQLGNDVGTVAQLNVLAPAAGVYTVLVGTNTGGGNVTGTGTYGLTLALTPAAFVVPADDEGGPLTNGQNYPGVIHLGDLDQWTFTANAGDAIALSIGEVSGDAVFSPWLRLRAPNGSQLGNDVGAVAQINVVAPAAGVYTVLVGTNTGGGNTTGTGTYRLTLAQTPGGFIVPADDQGGALTAGANHAGDIHLGDLDQWTFAASAGERIVISIAEVAGDAVFSPWIRLRAPNGTQIGQNIGHAVQIVVPSAPATGTYTVLVGTNTGGGNVTGVGSYLLGLNLATPVVSVTAPDNAASEVGPDAGTFRFSRTGSTALPLTATFTRGGAATAGSDYTDFGLSVTFPAGAATVDIVVTPLPDGTPEPQEAVALSLQDGPDYDLGSPVSASITIADSFPVVTVTASDADAGESGPNLGQFTFTRSGGTGDLSVPLEVSFAVAGSATAGVDYMALPPTVTIPTGEASTTLTVTPLPDGLDEVAEAVSLTLSPGEYFRGAPSSATLFIQDSGLPVVTIVATDPDASEAGPDTGTFTVSRTGDTAFPLSVFFTRSGTAAAGADFFNTLGGGVVIPAGLTTATITVTPINDASVEGPETVVLTLTDQIGYDVGTPNEATVTIADQPTPIVTIEATDANASEAGPDTGTFTVSRTGDTAFSLTVTFARTGTAAAGADFFNTVAGVVVIPVGQTTATITVTPINDLTVEGPETVVLTLTDQASYDIGTPNEATVTIADQPTPIVTIVASDPDASEVGLDTGTFTVTRTGDTAFALQVALARSGTAGLFGDYTGLSATASMSVSIPAGEVSTTITVTPINDSTVEGPETVVLTLTDQASYDVGTPNEATVTIADQPTPIVTISATDPDASEAGLDTGTFTVSRTGDTTFALQVSLARSGTATLFGDYVGLSASPSTLASIPAGAVSTTITVTPINDGAVEGPETVVLTLVDQANYDVGASGEATVTIADQPTPIVTIVATDPDAVEAGQETGSFRLSRTGDTTFALSVTLARTGTATAGGDYANFATTVSIPVGQASATITVTPVTDGTVEGPETVILAITDTASYDVGTPSSATVTITDTPQDGGSLVNGFNHTGEIALAGEVDSWTFVANAGDALSLSLAEIGPDSAFWPWIRLLSPAGAVVSSGEDWGVLVGQVNVVAPLSGEYTVLVASNDTGKNDTGDYSLILAQTGAFVVPPSDQGGALVNGQNHAGQIFVGDLDAWTFTATAGEAISLSIAQTGGDVAFWPWIRLIGPTGGVALAQGWGDLAGTVDVVAPVGGTYTVLVASNDTGHDNGGDYVLRGLRTPGAFVVPAGDEGGALLNGENHAGTILVGDLDAWTFTATAGEAISLSIAQTGGDVAFWPWIRLIGPTGG